jgi:L-malate glycosyltransferase
MSHTEKSRDRISVLRVVREFAPKIGGSITHILELAEMIDPLLNHQVIFAPYVPGCEDFDRNFSVEIVRARCAIERFHMPLIDDLLYSRAVRNDLINEIRRRNINIIHFHSEILAAYVIPYLRSSNPALRFVVMSHGWPERQARQNSIISVLGKILIGRVRPDYYLILDDGSQIQDLQSVLVKNSFTWSTVYHAIDTSVYSPDKSKEESSSFTVLFPHRPEPIKRPDLAVEIFRKFSSAIMDVSVLLVFPAGQKFDEPVGFDIPKEIAGQVRLLGGLDQHAMVECINRSSVAIGTSLNSNTGRAIQESMACAKPVVVFNNGRISDLITDGQNGILVEPGNIEQFVEALGLLYRNPDLRESIGKKARETIIKERCWEKRIEIELGVYCQIMPR